MYRVPVLVWFHTCGLYRDINRLRTVQLIQREFISYISVTKQEVPCQCH